ncbi:MAG: M23 family metallopeptidase [Verrucomicrobia bacterium]|nr:M23 family metallopeptidase [Verrucomicrobiota bacterium]MBU4248091.1 M23 family metallopeptidase [Verrucomicrobiota bacterium]MBU4496458.1 M23 family metallopeptidase [Verrucomicrobiota bacterium]
MHWYLGNVIVIEHKFDRPQDDLEYACSFYVHLGNDRKVKVGDNVVQGQVIGCIGKDKSEENGRYPAHLHFGVHKGPYYHLKIARRRAIFTLRAVVTPH